MKLLKYFIRSSNNYKRKKYILASSLQAFPVNYPLNKKYSTRDDGNADKYNLANYPIELIRNFSIIAHIDHGKSTLADRILEITGAISKDEENKQVLDKLQVEKERGITVKAQSATIIHEYDHKKYLLNLIDTPGHVDFSHEVSRSLSACQGVILLVDANEGIQAQTVANFYIAFAQDLVILPALNKIDLKTASPDLVTEQLKNLFGINSSEVLKVSAKVGTGVKDLLDNVVSRIPPPSNCDPEAAFRCLVYDSWFEKYKGVVCQVLVRDGSLRNGDVVQSCHTGKTFEVKSISILTPDELPVTSLHAGQFGLFTASIRKPAEAQVGDTFYKKGGASEPLSAVKPSKPMVYAGIFPMDQKSLQDLHSAIDKLTLNDSSVSVEVEGSQALGRGWRLGFLGFLHMDIFCTRLDQEYDEQVIITRPSVPYKVRLKGAKAIKAHGGEEIVISNAARWPESIIIAETMEPMVKATIISPDRYTGAILSLCEERRGERIEMTSMDNERILFNYRIPLSEVIVDFFDKLKRISSGYASFDYEDDGYESSELVKLSVLLNGKAVEELSVIVNKKRARIMGREMCLRLTESIPRQQFLIAVQAAIGSKVIARENIKPYRKDVTAKLYGGDVTRKIKLLNSQKEGKKRMRFIGIVEVPRAAFIKVLQNV